MKQTLLEFGLMVASGTSLVLTALGARDWLKGKGYWIVESEENAQYRLIWSLLYDTEKRIQKLIKESHTDMRVEHRLQLIEELNKIKKILKDDKQKCKRISKGDTNDN